MTTIYLLVHSYYDYDSSECEHVGAFTSKQQAEDARYRREPCDSKHDHWIWGPNRPYRGFMAFSPPEDRITGLSALDCISAKDHSDHCCDVEELELDTFRPIQIVEGAVTGLDPAKPGTDITVYWHHDLRRG